jgi:hypothetical protein
MWILVGWGVAERARFLAAPRDLHGQSNAKNSVFRIRIQSGSGILG